MGRLGMPELLIILAIAILVFGPKKLPDLGKAIGETIRGFKNSVKETEDDTATPVRR
jgi:sec-independent protein translocase protein TatA